MGTNAGRSSESHGAKRRMIRLILFAIVFACLTIGGMRASLLWEVAGQRHRPLFGDSESGHDSLGQNKTKPSSNASGLSFQDRSVVMTTMTTQPTALSSSFVNATNNSSKKLYVCGWEHPSIAQEIFPDYVYEGFLSLGQPVQRQDVVVFGSFGPCQYPIHQFPGKILYVNGEPDVQRIGRPNEYRIGPNEDGYHSIRYYHFVTILIKSYPPSLWAKIIDPQLRPQSTLEYKAVIYVAKNCVKIRQDAAAAISNSIPVVFGGVCTISEVLKNKRGWMYEDTSFVGDVGRDRRDENYKVYGKFQFCLVMDSRKEDGYISEKLLFAYLGGCLPIYYGTEDVFQIFHPESFVYYNVSHPKPALELLQYLYTNETAYQERMQKPILRHGNQTVEQYLSITNKIGNGSLRRRIREMMGLEAEVAN